MAQNSDGQIDHEVLFPVKGLDVSDAINRQSPLTTIDAENVRAYDPVSDRNRGAQRSGIEKYCPDKLASKSVQELFQAISTPGQAYGPGSGDSYVPLSTGFTVADLNGTTSYNKPRSPAPKHGTFDQNRNLYVSFPGNNGFPINNFRPAVGNLGAGAVNGNGGWGVPGGPQVVALGVVNALAGADLRIDNIELLATERLVVALARHSGFDLAFTLAFGGNAGVVDATRDNGDFRTSIWSYSAAGRGDLVATFAHASGAAAMVAIKITALAVNAIDKVAVASGASTTPSSGATAATGTATEMIIGAVGTRGPITDDAGLWTKLFADQRDGTNSGVAAANATISTAFHAVFSTAAYTAAKTAITSRDWCGLIATYK